MRYLNFEKSDCKIKPIFTDFAYYVRHNAFKLIQVYLQTIYVQLAQIGSKDFP